jgi:dihydrofolate reductase
MSHIALILALSPEGKLSKNKFLPWFHEQNIFQSVNDFDFQHIVITDSETAKWMPGPIDNRIIIVVCDDPSKAFSDEDRDKYEKWEQKNCHVRGVTHIDNAIKLANELSSLRDDVFIIGEEELCSAAFKYAQVIHLTTVYGQSEEELGDTLVNFSLKNYVQWQDGKTDIDFQSNAIGIMVVTETTMTYLRQDTNWNQFVKTM